MIILSVPVYLKVMRLGSNSECDNTHVVWCDISQDMKQKNTSFKVYIIVNGSLK